MSTGLPYVPPQLATGGHGLPLAEPCLDQSDADAIAACVSSGWVSTYSPLVPQFESNAAQWLGVTDSLAVNCGTSAIHLALLAAGVQPGDKVAVPALSFVATVNPVRYLGALPVFVDVEPATLGMCPQALSAALKAHPDIRAVVVTHLYGHLAGLDALMDIAGSRPVIEDAAEALGSCWFNHDYPRYAGTRGHYGCYSFNGNKTITTGSGGLLIAKQSDRLAHARLLASQGRAPDSAVFEHEAVGYNYRMNGIQAALGLSQWQKLPSLLRQRRMIADQYARHFTDWTPHLQNLGGQIPWLSTALFSTAEQRLVFAHRLADHGITTRPFFKPLPLLAPYEPFAQGQSFPVAIDLWQRGLCLPSTSPDAPERIRTLLK